MNGSTPVESGLSHRAADLLTIVENARGRLTQCENGADLAYVLATATLELGFAFFALAEHGDLADPSRSLVLATNYPAAWQRHFMMHRLDRIDPVQQACATRASGFCWSALATMIDLQPRQVDLLVQSRRYGLGDGFTVPLHVPGARAASCSFAATSSTSVPRDALWAAELIARAIYDHMRANRRAEGAVRLSPRQRSCVALMAAGLTDGGIARRLSLSEETVTKYLNAARRRYRLARRTQLVVVALRDGIVGYEDLALG